MKKYVYSLFKILRTNIQKTKGIFFSVVVVTAVVDVVVVFLVVNAIPARIYNSIASTPTADPTVTLTPYRAKT